MRHSAETGTANASCALQRARCMPLRVASLLGVLALMSPVHGVLAADDGRASPPIAPDFPHHVLDAPRVLTGNFGEARTGRYHAGLDFSTGGVVGRAVHAPADGWIERLRASGTGFGRAIYMRTHDGRTLVFGHLDHFDEPMASFVARRQDESGDYEQDLWPEPSQFPVKAGQRIAWTGQSGAGPPHLHVEVRRGDVAYNPLRAGIRLRDPRRPIIQRVTLEPLDATSLVDRGYAPVSVRLSSPADTVVVEGRVRAVVTSRDRQAPGRYRLASWATGISFDGATVACQFDSATWGGDIAEADMVYDRGRAAPGNGLVLWRSPEHSPVVIVGDGWGPSSAIEVKSGDPAKALRVFARDVDGNETAGTVWVRGPRAGEAGPDTTGVGGRRRRTGPDDAFDFAVLPERYVRISFQDAPPESRRVRINGRAATYRSNRWSVVVPFSGLVRDSIIHAEGVAGGTPWQREVAARIRSDDAGRWSFEQPAGFEWWIETDGVFEPGLLVETESGVPDGTSELEPRSGSWTLGPNTLALRKSFNVSIAMSEGFAPERVSMYRNSGGGWTRIGGTFDSKSRRFEASTRGLGRFALFADEVAPRVRLYSPRSNDADVPYSRWALEALVREEGSGLDRDASGFIVNGKRVPTEWDSEADRLRWRPLKRPAPGTYAYEVVAVDAAGNEKRATGTFVID